MTLEVFVTDSPEPAAREIILKGLMTFNQERAGPGDWRPFAVLLRDERQAVVGGLWARTAWKWLFIELLHVPEGQRHAGLGTRLVGLAEDEALRRGCHAAWLDTFSFQARGFYERLGYRVFGTLENYPPGHSRHFLQKTLTVR